MTTTTLTAENYDGALGYDMPADMRDEVAEALSSGREVEIEYRRLPMEKGPCAVEMVYFPRARRGGVYAGGMTDWTDCWGLDDLADRWEKYPDRWSN